MSRLVLCATLVLAVSGQVPVSPGGPAPDPLGRGTPKGSITTFIIAVNRNDLVTAGRCLQFTAKQSANTDTLARNLSELLDRYLSRGLSTISDSPGGATNDGLPFDRERIGPLLIGGRSVDIGLVRVNDPQAGSIWLVSSETLEQVPELHRAIEATLVERFMPATLVKHTRLGLTLAHWLVWAASIAIPLLGVPLVLRGIVAIVRRRFADRSHHKLVESWYSAARRPLIAVLTLSFHFSLLTLAEFPLTFRIVYGRVVLALLVAAFTWLLCVLLSLFFEQVRAVAQRRGRADTSSLVLLGERVLKVLIIVLAIFSVLKLAGVDTTTAVAGLGIGGVAVALGAQKTVENLLGGVFLLSDRALAVGDTCNIANRMGTIEDITLRSVRLRTVEQTLLSVPAGILAQASVENFSTRHKILAQTTLRLQYGTTADQLRSVLQGIRALLDEQPALETETSRIRLVNFGPNAVELELFAYVLTSDMQKFLSVREDLLLQIASVVESSGSGFANPTQVIQIEGASNIAAAAKSAG